MFTRQFDLAIKFWGAVIGGICVVVFLVVYFGVRNDVADVGYRPQQPVPFSHKLHAGDLKVSCQYCHAGVEESAHSPIPSTQTCMNCHMVVMNESPKLQLVRDSYDKGVPLEWVRIHKMPDYAHFNHSRHIRAQIDCQSCHGPVEQMGVVSQFSSLSMGWCLDCHRNPEVHIVGARPISGVFTGKLHKVSDFADSAFLYKPIKAQIGEHTPLTEPYFGMVSTPLPAHEVMGIPHPKKAGLGPENCSGCHY